MLQYCINSILCSGLLFFLYKILLEKEKINGFKRYYLLSALVLSFIAPLITISFQGEQQTSLQEYYVIEPASFIFSQPDTATKESISLLSWVSAFVYVIVACYLLIRLIYTITTIKKQRMKAETIAFGNAQLVLVPGNILPHSFLHTIYVNKNAYENGTIEKEILEHELTHVKQNHSLDILFAKLAQIIFWFNPFCTLILKSIQLNHEFLADHSAAKVSEDSISYQQLLLQKITTANHISISSPFNYLTIKKRLAMIQTQTPIQTQLFKKAVTICFAFAIVFLFINKETIAQTKPLKNNETTALPSTKEGATTQQLKEYADIIGKYEKYTASNKSISSVVTKEEKEKLLTIYLQMTEEQQLQQKYGFRPKPLHPTTKPITEDDLNKWRSSEYFVRINGRKIKNETLANKNTSDLLLSNYYVPNKGATDYGRYKAQVGLMTKEEYAKVKKYWEREDNYILVTFGHRPKN